MSFNTLIYILRIFSDISTNIFSKRIISFTVLGKKFVYTLLTNLIMFLA